MWNKLQDKERSDLGDSTMALVLEILRGMDEMNGKNTVNKILNKLRQQIPSKVTSQLVELMNADKEEKHENKPE